MLLVSFAISRDEVKVIIRIDQDLNLLICAGADTAVLLSTRGKELQSAEIDIEGGVFNHRHLQGGQETCILVVHNCVNIEGRVKDAELGFFLHQTCGLTGD